MKQKPIIGITLDSASNSDQYQYSAFPWYALRQNYVDCIIKAGGTPIMIGYDFDSINEIIEIIDGLVIPGGAGDVNPKFYGYDIISDKIKLNDQRALFEIELTKEALAKNIPFLGICNGMQVLNVACGGTLIQHIPDYIQSSINHDNLTGGAPVHSIKIKPGTMLSEMTNYSECMVNSTHHQAVGIIGDELMVSAVAPDGIVEAIESLYYRFVIGVEWHPEYLDSELDFELFKRLVAAARFTKYS
ncbi:MAG: gamma-glutamyl-gamma-aminobutyrate hydrolase family protein [Rickettsiaceae bacterium]|nr:MAG: gamma-glutamyl-gamma-aminobutyrate hydrolase family protein [Rickettsiaceae bacterium]